MDGGVAHWTEIPGLSVSVTLARPRDKVLIVFHVDCNPQDHFYDARFTVFRRSEAGLGAVTNLGFSEDGLWDRPGLLGLHRLQRVPGRHLLRHARVRGHVELQRLCTFGDGTRARPLRALPSSWARSLAPFRQSGCLPDKSSTAQKKVCRSDLP
ncbi:unnamed protein product [Prorocentrum cordatum]|uniref:Galectin n=1 Tax=Prorocentrum cordatum TaxID=2364126 RepID=A0ABN9RBF9_9DINO|nr:unnamed protein product [Polarella glacialis]